MKNGCLQEKMIHATSKNLSLLFLVVTNWAPPQNYHANKFNVATEVSLRFIIRIAKVPFDSTYSFFPTFEPL